MPGDRVTSAVIQRSIDHLNERREGSGVMTKILLGCYQPGDATRTYKLYVSAEPYSPRPIMGLNTRMTARECHLVVRALLAAYYEDER